MRYEQALELMNQGKVLLSKVSETVYEIKDRKLLAEGLEISFSKITAKERLGDWEEVRLIDSKEDFENLSDKEKENILSSAYKKYKFQINQK